MKTKTRKMILTKLYSSKLQVVSKSRVMGVENLKGRICISEVYLQGGMSYIP